MSEQLLNKLNEDMQKAWSGMKDAMDKQSNEIKQFGEASQETKNQVEKFNTSLTQLEDKFSKLEAKMNRPNIQIADNNDVKGINPEAVKAYDTFLRKGVDELTPEQVKLLTVSDDTTGGYLAPSEFVNDLIKDIVEYSPLRSLAKVRKTSHRSVRMPKRLGNVAAQWVGEVTQKTDTQNTYGFGMEDIPVHELTAMVDISNQDLEDTDFDLEADMRAEFAEQFGVAEALAFISGSGTKKPEGLLTNSEVGEVNSGIADNFNADSLMDIYYDLKSVYANAAHWLMNRQTIKAVRKFKDGNQNYIWSPGLNGQPPTILERPYVESPEMPDIAANAFPILFGDIKRALQIIDRTKIPVLRDPFTQATVGAVRFIARKRVGGQIVRPFAIRKMKCSL